MLLFSELQEFIQDLRVQKLRVFLTVFGIMWGTVAVVILLSFGTGFKKQTAENMHGMGEDIVILFPGSTTKPYQGFGIGRPIRLMEEDATLLSRQIPEIETISPEFSRWNATLRRGTKITRPLVSGVNSEYARIRNIIPMPGGRFLNVLDLEKSRHVVFLGDSVKFRLFGRQKAVGKNVLLNGVPFLVVGVMKHKTQNSSYNRRDEDRAFIPTSTFSAFFGTKRVNDLVYKPSNPGDSKQIAKRVYEVLGKKYKFDPTDKNAISLWDTTEMDKMLNQFFLGLNIFLGIIGSFTLFVGGIGVANIMYIVVRERTREIGIKRAIGAHRRDILLQFLGETFVIVGIGAGAGFILSVGIIRLAHLLPIGEFVGYPVFSGSVFLIVLLILGAVGLLAGFFPARKASRMNPIDCLRTS